jgi:hypothetical protein
MNTRRVYEWLSPTEPLSDDDRAKAVAFLERQARFDLAVWVGYRFRPGGSVDHELMLRSRGRTPGSRGRRTLFWGVTYELPTQCYVGFPTRAEMRQVRRVGEFVWERTGPPSERADPLFYRLTSEPLEAAPAIRDEIREAMEAFTAVSRVHIKRSKLWKSEKLLHEKVNVTVECEGGTSGLGSGPVGALTDLLRDHYLGLGQGFGVALGQIPSNVPAAIAYTRETPPASRR